jgi:ADP-ribosylglycohydrolase
MMIDSPNARLNRAIQSLEGLSVGDAFGEGFFMSFEMAARLLASGEFGDPPYDFQDGFILDELIHKRRLDFHNPNKWHWTDDTALALAIVDVLAEAEEIDGDELAIAFARRYNENPLRGYGAAMHSLLPRLTREDWREAAPNLFDGKGSYGNGAAMRVAPLGAYFADDLEVCVLNARLSARITHSHLEAVEGAVAVALAAALAARLREEDRSISRSEFCDLILPFLKECEVKSKIAEARDMSPAATSQRAAAFLGSGEDITAQDTVPFCVFCAGQYLENFEMAMWETVAGLGDRDTNCAIVGGIVAARVGIDGIPVLWRDMREALPKAGVI